MSHFRARELSSALPNRCPLATPWYETRNVRHLLSGVPVVRPNQFWSTDLTYVRLVRGFVYFVAIIQS